MKAGTIQAKLELQELSAARHYNIAPNDWDELIVEERTRLLAAFRDFLDLECIGGMSADEKSKIRGAGEWVMLKD